MKRFVYAPDVNVYIATTDFGIIDVSSDVISGSVTRNLNQVSTAQVQIQNPYHKYTRKFRPMDKIAIYLTRIKPTLVFTGYLDNATIDQLYPGPIDITASCTLKRLLYTFWDPSLPYVAEFMRKHGWVWDISTGNIYPQDGASLWNLDTEGSMGYVLRSVLNEVGNWPIGADGDPNTVHVLKLPKAFIDNTHELISSGMEATQEQRDKIMEFLTNLLTVQGVFGAPFGTTGDYNLTDHLSDTNPLPTSMAGSYHATIYGKGAGAFATYFARNAAADGVHIDSNQAKNAGLIYQIAKSKGYNDRAAIGWVADSYAESTLIANRRNTDSGAIGLFQLLSDGYFGPSGWIARAVKSLTGKAVNPQKTANDPYATSPIYNTHAFMNAEGSPSDINGLARPDYYIIEKYERPGSSGAAGDRSRADDVWGALNKTLTDLAANSNSSADGKVGDVIVGSNSFFKSDINHPESKVGYTFRIKGNPYGNDTYIFRAAKLDPRLGPKEIKIYVPGADDKSSLPAQNWHDKDVVVETSVTQAQRFPAPTATSTNTPATNTTTSGYVNPFVKNSGVITGQIDMGVDFSGGGHSEIVTIGEADIIGVNHNWYLNQPYLLYKLRTGPKAGKYVYVAEGIDILKSSGRVPAGTPIARFNQDPSNPSIEMGWGTETPGRTLSQKNGTSAIRHDAGGTPEGRDFGAFLGTLGTKVEGSAASDGDLGSTTTDAGSGGTQIDLTQFVASLGVGLPLTFPLAVSAEEAQLFRGERALANDQALMTFVDFVCKSSGRFFQSLPNGDFLAFYPDYFNWSEEPPYWVISDIETLDLNIQLGDDKLATHVFTTADTMTVNGEIDITDKMNSVVASVESPTFKELINVNAFDPNEFLQRYGARPLAVENAAIKSGFLQFMYGWMQFLQNWASMFYATPTFTFMPELYPGGLVEFSGKDLVMFINSVTHNFDRAGGFTTTAELTNPSTRSKSADWSYGAVLSGGFNQKGKS
jgi:hypothetical protein